MQILSWVYFFKYHYIFRKNLQHIIRGTTNGCVVDRTQTCRCVWRNRLEITCASIWFFFKWVLQGLLLCISVACTLLSINFCRMKLADNVRFNKIKIIFPMLTPINTVKYTPFYLWRRLVLQSGNKVEVDAAATCSEIPLPCP